MTPVRRAAPAAIAGAALLLAGCSSGSSAGGPTPPRSAGSSAASSAPASATPDASTPARLAARVVTHLPDPTSRAVALADQGALLLLGGLASGDVTTGRVVRVDLGSGAGSVLGSLSEPVHDASGAVLGGVPTVFGGGAATEMADAQAWTGTTSRVVGRLPTARSDTATATVGDTAYVIGGYDGSTLPRTILATKDGRTFHVAGTLHVPVRYPAVTAAGRYVLIVGGDLSASTSSAGGGQTAAIQRFDPATGRTTVIGRLPAPMGHAMAFTLGPDVFVAGGRSGTAAQSAIWQIDPSTGSALRIGRLPYAVSDAATAVVGGAAYLAGGETDAGPTQPLDTLVRVTLR